MRRTTKRALLALNLALFDTPGLVSFTRGVGKGLTNNPHLTAADTAKLPVAVADLLTSASNLEATHTLRPTNPSKANTKLERTQADGLMEQLTETGSYIEGLANTKAAGSVALAQQIITSCGFQLKKGGVKHAAGFTVDSPVKGAAHVHLPKRALGDVRVIRYSMDGGKTYSLPIIVHGNDMTITALTSGVDALFEYATSTPPEKKSKATIAAGNEAHAWSDARSCVIS